MPATSSIEYAHIYTNQSISIEHRLSVERLHHVIKNTREHSSLVVMVDDYSFPDPTFDYAAYRDWLAGMDALPDMLIRESQLIPVCDEVMKILQNETMRKRLIDYIKIKRYPCSLFIAAWYLVRLGKLESPLFPASLHADELVNILPESFRPYEEKGVQIIAATPFSECVKHISYEYLPN